MMGAAHVLLALMLSAFIWTAPVAAQGPAGAARQADPFIDRGTVMAGCGVGVAWGAVSLATYPIWKWAKDAGAILSMGVMAWRSVLGCYYGIVGGLVVSGTMSAWRMAEDSLSGVSVVVPGTEGEAVW